jgi:hypothetical protein
MFLLGRLPRSSITYRAVRIRPATSKFAADLEVRLSRIEQGFVVSQLGDEHFTDLMEEALRQAARSLSDDRRAQIANVVAGSLTSEDITYVDSKHLLSIAGELNDIEVIRLGRYVFDEFGTGQEYWERHASVLEPVAATFQSSQGEIDRETLQQSYDEHFARLGLVSDGRLTRLGRLLCRELEVPSKAEQEGTFS